MIIALFAVQSLSVAHVRVSSIIWMIIAIAFILRPDHFLIVHHFAHTLSLLAPLDVVFGLRDNLVENVGKIFLVHKIKF